ncbi:penicillin-insensitive murein endopeptidase [bacterium]|nr:penicillin-insensitive murein endopeptidase [bacterium]
MVHFPISRVLSVLMVLLAVSSAFAGDKDEAAELDALLQNVLSSPDGATDTSGILYEDDVDNPSAEDYLDPDTIDLTGQDLTKVPCLSVGAASRGRLVNGVYLTESPGIRPRANGNNWGTPETIAALRYAVAKVHQQYPGAHELVIGDITAEHGGRLKTHRSHQAGRDADIGYYYKGIGQPQTFLTANRRNLDVPRTWALLEGVMEDNKAEYIFIDISIQRILYDYVKYTKKAPASYLDKVFQYNSKNPRAAIIRHARGHANHIHVRFWSPIAVAAAKNYQYKDSRLAALSRADVRSRPQDQPYVSLAEAGTYDWGPAPKYRTVKQYKTVRTSYKVRKGDTLSGIGKRTGVGTSKLMKWNGMNGRSIIRPGQNLVLYQRKLVEVQVPVQVDPEPGEAVATQKVSMNVSTNPSDPAPKYYFKTHNVWHKVKKGDTLWTISKQHKTSIDKIRSLNGKSATKVLRVGTTLKVKTWQEKIYIAPTPESDPAPTAAPAVSPNAPTAPAKAEPQANAVDNNTPVKTAAVATDQVAATSPTADTTDAADSAVSTDEEFKSFEYIVTDGDTLLSIAKRFNLDVVDICKWNDIEGNFEVEAGRKLVLKMKKVPLKIEENRDKLVALDLPTAA